MKKYKEKFFKRIAEIGFNKLNLFFASLEKKSIVSFIELTEGFMELKTPSQRANNFDIFLIDFEVVARILLIVMVSQYHPLHIKEGIGFIRIF